MPYIYFKIHKEIIKIAGRKLIAEKIKNWIEEHPYPDFEIDRIDVTHDNYIGFWIITIYFNKSEE